jgi:UDP-N-acetylglucosamine 1-carboxyvinyltransferase
MQKLSIHGGTPLKGEVAVTGTENLMMAACLASGTTVLENAAREPEVVYLAKCPIGMGARVTGHGTDVVTIEGETGIDRIYHLDRGYERIESRLSSLGARIAGLP